MSVCPTVSVLRFYGCCHPCWDKDNEVLKVFGNKIKKHHHKITK